MNTFTEEEVTTAKATRNEIIQQDILELKAIYIAGEICMWDEMRNKIKGSFLKPEDKEHAERIFEILNSNNHNYANHE